MDSDLTCFWTFPVLYILRITNKPEGKLEEN
jgi:hypothetical protein